MTDANLVLGRLGTASPLAGGIALDADAAEAAVGALAGRLGLDVRDCAQGILDVANAEMVRALRVMTVERGIDPRELALLPFGGAGPLHAAAIADALDMRTILCPRASGVLAALGLVVSERRRDAQRSVLLSGQGLTEAAIREHLDALGARAAHGLDGARLRAVLDLRYRGQAFELSVEAPPEPDALREAFEAAHERAYGYRDPDGEVELVTVRVTAAVPGPDVGVESGGGRVERSRRSVVFAGEELEATVLHGEPAPGDAIEGPAVVELAESTLVVPPGWSGRVQTLGTIRLERA